MWLSQIQNFKSTWISLLALIIDSNFIEPPVWDTIVILTNEPMIYTFIFLLFTVLLENISLTWRRHH